MPDDPAGHLLVDREIAALCGGALRASAGAAPIAREQIQPSSVDLRLGTRAVHIRASFLPGATSVEERLSELALATLDLAPPGAVLERGGVYLIELAEELALPRDLRASFNPRSSAGRSDLFTRVVVPGHARFNHAPAGYRGRLWAEVAPLSFAVRLAAGDRLCQMRLERGRAALTAGELEAELARTPLVHGGRGPLAPPAVEIDDQGGLALHLGLSGRHPAGWRARAASGVLQFGADGVHGVLDFWEPLEAPGGHCLLPPGGFQLFASRERVAIPPELAAEMLPIDTGLGEMRNNYAGFFDNGFGWPAGTPAVLEVRAHDVPFLVEDGQVFFRLRFFRTGGRPERLYAEGRERSSYRDQDLTPARCFRRPPRG
jgi:dCTP deaminase